MKRLAFAVTALSIVGGSALAADLPPPMAPPPRAPAAYIPVAAPFYNWSGFYIGGNLGAAWNSGGSVSDTFGSTFSGSGQTTKFTGRRPSRRELRVLGRGRHRRGGDVRLASQHNKHGQRNRIRLEILPRRRSTVDG